MKRFTPFVRHSSSGRSTIRIDGYSNPNRGVKWWDIRKEVFERDGGLCQNRIGGRLCLKPGTDVHHIKPLSKGGTTTKPNLMTVCKDCHESKHHHMR